MNRIKHDQCFNGTHVRYYVYTPDTEIVRRAMFACSAIGDAKCWDEVCRRLCGEGVLCVVIELPGFGTSPVKAPQDNKTRARIFWGVLDEVDYSRGESNRSWHLVSHGSACGIILEMARTEPMSVVSRALISPVTDKFTGIASSRLLTTGFGRWMIHKMYSLCAENRRRFDKRLRALYGSDPDEKRATRLYAEFVRRGRVDTLIRMFNDGYRINRRCYEGDGNILIIWGRQDRIFGENPPKRFTDNFSDTEIHLIDSAHMAMETHPDVVGDYLKGWFAFREGRMEQPKPVGKKAPK